MRRCSATGRVAPLTRISQAFGHSVQSIKSETERVWLPYSSLTWNIQNILSMPSRSPSWSVRHKDAVLPLTVSFAIRVLLISSSYRTSPAAAMRNVCGAGMTSLLPGCGGPPTDSSRYREHTARGRGECRPYRSPSTPPEVSSGPVLLTACFGPWKAEASVGSGLNLAAVPTTIASLVRYSLGGPGGVRNLIYGRGRERRIPSWCRRRRRARNCRHLTPNE